MKKKTSSSIQVGAAEVEIKAAPGLPLLGQMHERLSRFQRDPLQANAIAFRQGGETVVIVAVDICMLPDSFVRPLQEVFAKKTGVRGARLLLHSTHTHVAPTVFTLLTATADPKFVKTVQNAILEAATKALKRLQACEVYSGTGHMEQMGWNRRAMFKDGSSRMYSSAEDKGYIGLEGPRDPALPVLFTRNKKGDVTAVLVNFASHPNCLEGDYFYSADFPGEARRQLKALLGAGVTVVYLTGAAGNTAPSILDPLPPEQMWRGDSGVKRSGLFLAGEAAKVIASTLHPMPSPKLRVEQQVIKLPYKPWPKAGSPTDPFPWIKERPHHQKYYNQAKQDWPRLTKEESPGPVALNVVRIGDAAVCTNGAELFVEFGIQIRKQSPARVTFVSQLTDGYIGYVPTLKAFRRGGYETWPAPTSRLASSAGPTIVKTTGKMLKKAFAK